MKDKEIIKYIKKNQKIYLDTFALKTRLPIIEAQRILNKLLTQNDGDVRVDENGKLIYIFNSDLKRDEDLLKLLSDILKGIIIFFKDAFIGTSKLLMLFIFISYSIVYLFFLTISFIFTSLLFTAARNEEVTSTTAYANSSTNIDFDDYMKDFYEMLGFAFSLKSFKEVDNYSKRAPFHVKIFSFVFGDNYKIKKFKNDKNILKFVKNYQKITLSDIVNLTGFTEAEAKKLILDLVVKYEGEIDVSKHGILYYKFPNFDFRGINKGFSYIWERKLKKIKLNQNDEETNTQIMIFGIINLILSSVVSFGALDNISFLSEDILFYMKFWFGYLALFYSIIFFLIPIFRIPFVSLKNKTIDKINYIYYLFNDFSYNINRDYVDMDETDDEAEEYLFKNYPNLFIHDFIDGKDVINLETYHEEIKFTSKGNPENIKIYDPDDVDFLSSIDDDF